MSPPLIPPEGGRRMEGMERFLLSYDKLPEKSCLWIPDFFRLGMETRDLKLDFR
jgi:hypothetical protein